MKENKHAVELAMQFSRKSILWPMDHRLWSSRRPAASVRVDIFKRLLVLSFWALAVQWVILNLFQIFKYVENETYCKYSP